MRFRDFLVLAAVVAVAVAVGLYGCVGVWLWGCMAVWVRAWLWLIAVADSCGEGHTHHTPRTTYHALRPPPPSPQRARRLLEICRDV